MNSASPKIKWGLLGSSGKMGSQVIRVFSEDPSFNSRMEFVFEDSGRNANLVQEKLFESKPDLLLDFSQPDALLPVSLALKKLKTKVLICSTGWTNEQKQTLIKNLGSKNLKWLPNTSPGIALIVCAIENCLVQLPNPSQCKISIWECHHLQKKDTPSGTALWLKEKIKETLSNDCPSIEIQSQREGDVVGTHKIVVTMPNEKIELSHEVLDRRVFATGALDHLLRFGGA